MSRLSAPDLVGDAFDHFAYRVMQDAWADATAAYWRRRAEQLEAARPRPGEYAGRASIDDLRAQWQRLTDAAQACRARAAFLEASRNAFDETLHDIARSEAA